MPYGQPFDPRYVREHGDANTVLVLGILGLVLCGILGPIAWVKGNRVKREMDAQPSVQWTNRGMMTAGRICGIVSTVILAMQVVFLIVWIVLFISISN
jgi:hypothetical protein